MEAVELKFLNVLIDKLHLTDEEKADFVEDFEKVRESRLNSSMGEFRSLLKDYFHALELKLEQQNTNLEQFKADINTKLGENKDEINTKIADTKDKLTNLFITGFITVVVMILTLFATIVFKFIV